MKNSKIIAQINNDRNEGEISGNAKELLELYAEITCQLASSIHEKLMKVAFEYGIAESRKEGNKKWKN